MGSYELGNWTQSALETLSFFVEKQLKGEPVTFRTVRESNLPNRRTMLNWVTVLKKPEGNYLIEKDGELILTGKGKELFRQLKEHPPISRQGRPRNVGSVKEAKPNSVRREMFRVTIQGKNVNIEASMTSDNVQKILDLMLKN